MVATSRTGQHDAHVVDWRVERNWRMAYHLARRLWRLGKGRRLGSLEDLAHEGVVFLRRAAELYDGERGTKFSTYAWHVLNRGMRLRDSLAGVIRVPSYEYGNLTPRNMQAAARAYRVSGLGESTLYEEALLVEEDVLGGLADEEMLGLLRQALPQLVGRHRLVVERRLAGESFPAIGRQIGCGKERVRQLYAAALGQLRALLGVAEGVD